MNLLLKIILLQKVNISRYKKKKNEGYIIQRKVCLILLE